MMGTEQQPRTVTSHDLWNAANTLMGRRSDDLIAAASRKPGLPSLWRQLTEFVQSGRGSAGHGLQESKPPLDVTALGLMILIADTIGLACHTMQIARTFDAFEDLHQVIRRVTADGDPDVMAQWHRALTSWCQRIRTVTMNDPDRPTRLHGTPCKACGATSVRERGSDGVVVNQPALVVSWADGLVRAVECQGCGVAWFRGSGLLTMRRTDNGH